MECPNGHFNPHATRLCTACGHLFPLSTGTETHLYTIQAMAFQLPGRNLYWATDQKHTQWLVSEAKEIYQPTYRKQLMLHVHHMQPLLGAPPAKFWHQDTPVNRLVYTAYPGKILESAMPIELWLRQQGLPTDEQLESWLSQLFEWGQRLLDTGLIAPGLTAWNIWVKTNGQLWFSEWEYIDRLKGPVGFHPISYAGYAPPIQLSRGLIHPKTFWYSVWALCFQLTTGKPPQFWAPETPTPETYRYLWHRNFYDWMSRFYHALIGAEENAWPQFQAFFAPFPIFKNEAAWQTTHDANLLFWQGYQHYQTQGWEQAVTSFSAAIEHNLLEPHHYRFLGKVFVSMQEFDAAQACYDKAINMIPLAVFSYEAGQILLSIHQHKPAIRVLKHAVATFPRYWQAWNALGTAHMGINEMDRASEAYTESLAINPRQPQPYQALYSFYSQLGMKEQAEKYLHIYEKLDLGDPFFQIQFTDNPMRRHNYEITCAAGHVNKITVVNCQTCGHSLYLQPGETIHQYAITDILVPGRYNPTLHSLVSQIAIVRSTEAPSLSLILKESFLVGKMSLRAQTEKRMLAKISHPGIPKLYDTFAEQYFGQNHEAIAP